MPRSKASNTRDDRKYNPIKPNPNDFLLNILENDNTVIDLISASSLSGFIFKISNNEKSYIMKIIVLSDVEKQLLGKCMKLLPSLSRRKRKKITEIKKDFVYESEIQNFINNESKRGGRTPICPGVIYTKIYDNHLSQHFLKLLRNKSTSNNNTEINSVFECLQYYFSEVTRNTLDQYNKTHYKLGIILMPEIENSIVLGNVADAELKIADNHIYSQIIYLFLIIGIINFDMHKRNMLVSNKDGIITTKLIDFGKVDNLNKIENSSFLYANEKIYINGIRADLMNELNDIVFEDTTTNETKHNFILKTMNIINLLCWIHNKREYNYENVLEHQMDWFVPVGSINLFKKLNYNTFKEKKETINFDNLNYEIKNLDLHNYNYKEDDNYVQAFELLKNNYVTINTKGNTYTNLPVVELTLTDYNMTKPPAEEAPMWIDNSVQLKKCEGNENDDANCTIMGGKKSTKKNITRKYIRKSSKKSHKKAIRKTK